MGDLRAATTPLKRRVAVAEIADILRARALSGAFVSDFVREEEVAVALGVSRTPVREAIRLLVGEGLLLKEHSRSARVFRPSLEDLHEIYEIRTPLEGLAARKAAALGGPCLADELVGLLDELARAEPGVAYSACHEAFHLRLIDASGSRRLATMIRGLRVQSEPYVRLALQAAADFREEASAQHREIVAAVRRNESALADELVSNHLRDSMARVPRILALAPGDREERRSQLEGWAFQFGVGTTEYGRRVQTK